MQENFGLIFRTLDCKALQQLPPSEPKNLQWSANISQTENAALKSLDHIPVLVGVSDIFHFSETPVCFIILFVRNFWGVCSQFWLSVRNFA